MVAEILEMISQNLGKQNQNYLHGQIQVEINEKIC